MGSDGGICAPPRRTQDTVQEHVVTEEGRNGDHEGVGIVQKALAVVLSPASISSLVFHMLVGFGGSALGGGR